MITLTSYDTASYCTPVAPNPQQLFKLRSQLVIDRSCVDLVAVKLNNVHI